jgi:hypothetical protein
MRKYGNQKIVGILMSGIRLVEIELLIDIYIVFHLNILLNKVMN